MQGKEEEIKRKKRGKEKGNLDAHLRKLEEAGYVEVRKEFAERKPATWYEITAAGSKALGVHLGALETLVNSASS